MEEQIDQEVNEPRTGELRNAGIGNNQVVQRNRGNYYKSLFPKRHAIPNKVLVIPSTLENWFTKIDLDKMIHWQLKRVWIPIILFICISIATYFTVIFFHTFETTYTATSVLLYQKKPKNSDEYMSISTVKEMITMRRNCQGVKTLLGLEMSIDDMQDDTDVYVARNTNLMELSVISNDPEQAKEIVNTLAEVALSNNRNFYENRAKTSLDTYSQQVEKARKKANPAQAAFVMFKQQNNILDIDLSKKQLIDYLSGIVAQEIKMSSNLTKQKNNLALLKQMYDNLPAKIAPGGTNDSILEQELVSMQARYRRLSEEYREKNPKLLQLKENMKKLRANLENGVQQVDAEVMIINPAIKKNKLAMLQQESAIKLTEQKIIDIQVKLDNQKKNLALFPNLQQQYSKLSEKKILLETKVSHLEESAENAVIDFVRPHTDFEIYELATIARENDNHMRIIISGVTGGTLALIIFIWILISYLVNLKLSTEKEITLNYTPPCLMPIPDFSDEDMRDITSPFRNHIEALAEQIALHTTNDALSVAICSAHSSSSKSVIAYELARFYARLGLKTVFLDFDNGPDGVFEKTHDLEDIINHEDATDRLLEEQGTFEKLKLDQHANMHDCLKSLACNSFFERVKAKNDVVIIDAPGILEGLHSCDIINMAEYQIFSVHSGIHKKSVIDKALIKLQELRIHPIGIILNSVKRQK